ncbi:MAG: hypothetical protein ITF98_05680 [Fermentimonas sp.]|nr:hypothetical protein [Fermentimonas sp.]
MKQLLLYIKFALQFAFDNKTLKHIKHYKRWYSDMHSGKTTLSLGLPWMTYDAIDFLKEITSAEKNVFEWGSGGSTLFLATRCKHVITIEHDKEWSKILKEKLNKLDIENVTLQEIEGERIDNFFNLNPENADDFVSKELKSSGLSYEKYVKAIDQYNNNHFDIIVVDGRVRNACIKRAIPHIKKGGYLIVDNSDRSYYLSEFNFLNNQNEWKKNEFVGPVFFQHAFSKTSIFKKLF